MELLAAPAPLAGAAKRAKAAERAKAAKWPPFLAAKAVMGVTSR
jgi:hypothetical protein